MIKPTIIMIKMIIAIIILTILKMAIVKIVIAAGEGNN